jgi:RNA-directed DNA polymerase
MQTEIVEKRLVSNQELAKQGKRVNGLFRLMAQVPLWEQAYDIAKYKCVSLCGSLW